MNIITYAYITFFWIILISCSLLKQIVVCRPKGLLHRGQTEQIVALRYIVFPAALGIFYGEWSSVGIQRLGHPVWSTMDHVWPNVQAHQVDLASNVALTNFPEMRPTAPRFPMRSRFLTFRSNTLKNDHTASCTSLSVLWIRIWACKMARKSRDGRKAYYNSNCSNEVVQVNSQIIPMPALTPNHKVGISKLSSHG